MRDHAFFAARTGQLVIELRRAAQAQCAKLCFEVAADEDFADIARRLTAHGVKSEMKSDTAPGIAKVLAFQDPKGTTIELFKEWQSVGRGQDVTGIGVLKLGHIAFCVDDPKPIADFYARVLGFKVSDWIDDFFVFMRCNADHHTVNFITGPHGRMHHIAFELRDFSHLQNACDLFGAEGHPDHLGAGAARPRPQRRGVPPQSGRPGGRGVRRARPDEGRGARLFRSAALAQGPSAAAQGVAARRGLAVRLGAAAAAGFRRGRNS